MSAASKRDLVALAEEHRIHLFSDEVYRLLELDPSDRSPSMAEI